MTRKNAIIAAVALVVVALLALAQTGNNNIQSQPVALTNAGQAGTIAAVKTSAPAASDGAVAVELSPNNAGAVTLANYPTSQTTTARNLFGAIQTEKGSRWAVFSNPAAPTIASASLAAEANVRHVADCIAFSAANGTALTPALATVNLRDGATGAGTILWTYEFWLLAGPGQAVAPFSVCGLNLVGTTNTAMTLEFNAGVTNLTESVSISGYNIN